MKGEGNPGWVVLDIAIKGQFMKIEQSMFYPPEVPDKLELVTPRTANKMGMERKYGGECKDKGDCKVE
jgi:hypothetical protein